MFHQFPDFCYAVSHRLSNILDVAGYSQEDRDRMVMTATGIEVFNYCDEVLSTFTDRRMYLFGSRGDGSTGHGLNSDTDFLSQENNYEIVTDLSGCQAGKIYFYMLQDGPIHPGYVKLQKIRILPDNTPVPLHDRECTLDSFGVPVLPNTSFHIGENEYRSGPATHVEFEGASSDFVVALRCSQWPSGGYEWFYRRRFHDWPKPCQIQNIWKYGCFATPVGHPSSNEEHLEWRLSFSIAERDLVRSFEDTIMKVYILLKIVKKTFIEPVLGDAFSSYHCKVCMLWMRESTPSELWCTGNLLCCLMICIRQLYEWAIAGVCSDYFIVRNNIYDRKIVGMTRMKLIQILEWLLSDDCRFLFRIECCHIGRLLVDDLSSLEQYHFEVVICEKITEYIPCVIAAIKCRISMLRAIPQNVQSLILYLSRFVHASKYAPHAMQYQLKHIVHNLCSQLGFYFASVLRQNTGFFSLANVEYLLALTSECLYHGMKSDATSVRLKLCGLGIVMENHDLAETCLQDICENRMKYMFSASPCGKLPLTLLNTNVVAFIEKCLNVTYTTEEMLKNQVSFSVVYIQSEISITPVPLRMEMFRSFGTPIGIRYDDKQFWYDWAVVDSLMCLYFFQYINFSRQGKDRHKQVAMDNMIHVIKTEPDIPHKETALNLLAYCYLQDNQPRNAFICLRESLKICPHHNAAKFYLGLLFKTVVAAVIRPPIY